MVEMLHHISKVHVDEIDAMVYTHLEGWIHMFSVRRTFGPFLDRENVMLDRHFTVWDRTTFMYSPRNNHLAMPTASHI